MVKTEIQLTPGFILLLIIALLLIPLRITLSWLCAVIVHELGHLLCIRLFRKEIFQISIGFYGAKIRSETMTQEQEIVAALCGPAAGLILSLFSKTIPTISFFSIFQTVCNLLPIYPMDGGRILLGVLELLISPKYLRKIYIVISSCMFLSVFLIAIYVSLFWLGKPLLVLVLLFLAIRIKLSCKQSLQAIQ